MAFEGENKDDVTTEDQATLAGGEGEDTLPAEGEDTLEGAAAEEDEAELSIVIEGEEPEPDELALDPEEEAQLGEKGKKTLKHLRKLAEDRAKEARELARKLAEVEAANKPKVEPPKRPTLEECGFDEDEFTRRTEAYVLAQAEARKAQEAEAAAAKASEDDYKARHTRYTEQKQALKVEGFDAAEDAVKEALSKEQQSIIIRNVSDPATVVYALGRSPKKLAELSAIKDLDRFAFRLAQLQGEIKVTTKAPPPAETKLRGGAGAPPAVNPANLAKMRQKAEETGDFTDYFRAKAEAKAAGLAV